MYIEESNKKYEKRQKNKENRPNVYQYFEQLEKHLGGDLKKIFNGKIVYPRQLELHLPTDHKKPCVFNCFYCAGKRFQKDLGDFEMNALELLRKLDGRIPYVIYGGSYTEPLLNPYFMAFLAMTKKTGSHFGIHTNGSMLKRLEETQGWLTVLSEIAEDKVDYLSISLDAGSTESHCKIKGVKHDWYSEIIEGIKMAVKASKGKKGPAVRVCYLLNEFNSSEKEIANIVKTMKDIGVDSLRFSIPFAPYAQDFDVVRQYKQNVEDKNDYSYYKKVEPYLSKSQNEKPFIFYISPEFQNIELFNFKQCIYGYYQICWGADGYVYRCTTISTPTFKELRLGKITDDLEKFNQMILKNQDPTFNCNKCFSIKGRCNRMGLEINKKWKELNE